MLDNGGNQCFLPFFRLKIIFFLFCGEAVIFLPKNMFVFTIFRREAAIFFHFDGILTIFQVIFTFFGREAADFFNDCFYEFRREAANFLTILSIVFTFFCREAAIFFNDFAIVFKDFFGREATDFFYDFF